MTATVLAVVPLTRAVLYDGTNSAEIEALLPEVTIVSEISGNLTVESPGGEHTVPTDGYLIFNPVGWVTEATTESYFGDYYQIIPDPAELEALAEGVAGLEALPDSIEAVGIATFGAILATQSAVVPVNLVPAMPDSDYTATPQLFGGTNIGSLAITNVAVVDADTVNVTVQNNGIISIGASLLVTASAN